MTFIEIAQLPNGAHNNQTIYGAIIPVPEGWALLLPEVATNETENFPFANIETKMITKDEIPDGMDISLFGDRDSIDVVTKWEVLPIPEPEPIPEPTPAEKRRNAYMTEKIVNWPQNSTEMITVDEANEIYLDYLAEGKDSVCEAIQELIQMTKADIRERFPDASES